MKLRTLAMATPFRAFINERIIKNYLVSEQITVVHNNALGIERNTEIRRLPIPAEYNFARKTYLECAKPPTASTFPAAAGAAFTMSAY